MAKVGPRPADGPLFDVEVDILPHVIEDYCETCQWLIAEFLPPLLDEARKTYLSCCKPAELPEPELPLTWISTEIPWDRDLPRDGYIPPKQPQFQLPSTVTAVAAAMIKPAYRTCLPKTRPEDPPESAYYRITAWTRVDLFNWQLGPTLIEALRAEFRELFPAYLAFLGQATGQGKINGWGIESPCGGIKFEFPRIICPGAEHCFWYSPILQRDFGPGILQIDIASRWFGQDIARIVCKSNGHPHWPYALGDKCNDTTCVSAQFTFRGLSTKGREVIRADANLLGGDCVSVDVILRLNDEALDPPRFVVTEHYIEQAGDCHLALRRQTLLMGQFVRRLNRSTGQRHRLEVPRLTYRTRYLRRALEAALKMSYHPEDRETPYFAAEKGKRRTR